MTQRIAMSKLLQRTCLVLNQQPGELLHIAHWSRCLYKLSDSPCNSTTTTTAATRPLMTSPCRFITKFTAGPHHHPTARLGTAPPLCQDKAYELVLTLNDVERNNLKSALTKYDTMKLKEGFEGALAATRWRTKFGRPTKVPPLSNVDPSGEFCTFPEDWLQKTTAAKAIPPSTGDLYRIFFVNAVPFVAFGFLDNFCMIMAGDYIEQLVGSFMCISTMAAAGLGNTISDVLGIGTAFYVESFCTFMGLKPPELGVIQMEMKQTRRAANIGRIIGITLGCLLGMFPLVFLKKDETSPPPPPPATKSDKTKKDS